MATKPKNKTTVGARSFKKSGEGFTPLAAGEEIRGKFVRMRKVMITDRETRERKEINAYDLQLEDGSNVSISGRALLDDAFRDVFDAIGQDKLAGQEISIIRGEDVDTPEGNQMGTYEILVWEKSSF